MRVALDTNRYSDLGRGDAELASILERSEEIVLPFIVVGELRGGFAFGQRTAENERALRSFLAEPGVAVLFADDGTTRHYASVYRQLRLQGTSIPTNDIWIAALVLQHDLVLCTRDRHFRHLPQIATV